MRSTEPLRRSRWRVSLWIPIVIAAGLGTRAGLPLPDVITTYGGDTLYAVLMYVLIAWISPGRSPSGLAMIASAVCGVIELSQLWHPPWLDAIRATRPGALVLGRGFVWSDLLCYLIGATAAAGVDKILQRRAQCQHVES